MNIEHTINKENGTVEVTVTLPPRNDDKIAIRQNYIRNYLTEQKVKATICIQDNCVLNTIPPYSGKWVFRLDKHTKSVVKSRGEKVSRAKKAIKTKET